MTLSNGSSVTSQRARTTSGVTRIYLDGTARKWYLCSTLPTKWRDVAFPVGTGPNGADILAEKGVSTLLLKKFLQQNYKLFQETRLRNRVQGIKEPITNYYHD